MHAMSTPLTKALGSAHASDRPDVAYSQSPDFASLAPRGTEPLDDGCFAAGLGATQAPQQALVIPFSQGQGEYGLRLWGWWSVGDPADANSVLWVPLLLAEFRCTSGAAEGLGRRLVRDGQLFAGQVVLAAGGVGQYGSVNSGLPVSFAVVDLRGCRKFQFDFTAPGNALWAKTSSF
jgi:hypothetical protein